MKLFFKSFVEIGKHQLSMLLLALILLSPIALIIFFHHFPLVIAWVIVGSAIVGLLSWAYVNFWMGDK